MLVVRCTIATYPAPPATAFARTVRTFDKRPIKSDGVSYNEAND
jgi:hypothetical protein